MNARASACMGAVGLTLLAFTRPALGDEGSDAQVRAQQLFESGLADATAGRYAAACPKFAASQAADPKTSTLLNLGRCYENLGRTASAWATLREAEALARKAGRSDLEATARANAEAIAPRLVRLTITVPADARIPGLVVSRDGKKLAAAEWDVAIPADPGDHEIVAEAPAHRTWHTNVKLFGSDQSIAIAPLEPAPVAPPAPTKSASSWTTLRTTGVVVGGVGALTFFTGLALGIVAKSQYDDARGRCDAGAAESCPATAVSDGESARSLANAGTFTMIAGGALVAAGGALFLFSPRASQAGATSHLRASARLGLGSVGLVGEW